MTFAADKFRKFLPAAMFAMVVEFVMGLAGSVVCGHVLGGEGLSVVNLMQPVMELVSFLALLIGTGASVLYATEMGRFDKRRASEFLTQGLWSALIFGAGLLAVLALARGASCAAFGVSGKVLDGVREFWLWFLPCAVLEPLKFFAASMCYADGDGRICVYAYLVQLFGCCVLAFPLTMAMGFAGCALGMGLWNLAAILVLLCHLRSKVSSLKFVKHFSLFDTLRICRCSVGDASVKLCQAGVVLALNFYVVKHYGEGMLPVLAVVVAILSLSEVFDGIGTAAQPLTSVYIGERNDRLTRRIMTYAGTVAVGAGVAIMVALLAFPQLVVWLVGLRGQALEAPALLAARIASLGLPAVAAVMLLNSYYTFCAKEGLAAAITVLSTLLIPMALLPLAGMAGSPDFVWLALAVSPYLAIAAIAWYVRQVYGKASWPLFLSRQRERNQRVFDLILEEKSICDIAAKIGKFLRIRQGMNERRAGLSSLLVEETLMTIKDHNQERRIDAEITIDRNDPKTLCMTIRDDGEIFDLTDADAQVTSLRQYLVSNIILALPARRNMTTTGFNRNCFKI